jgi:hypothetical protein
MWTGHLQGSSDDLRELGRLPPELDRSPGDARNIEQIVHQPDPVADLAFEDFLFSRFFAGIFGGE